MNRQEENIARINKVKKYINENVEDELPLSQLAEIANFSTFHFQRTFKSIAGETPKQYIKRIRLEAAAHHTVLNPQSSILEVALENGFNSLEAFSRAFKNYYGLSPDSFRKMTEEDKMSILQKKTNVEDHPAFDNSIFLSSSIIRGSLDLEIKTTKIPAQKLIYIPLTLKDTKIIKNGMQAVRKWAKARDLINPRTEYFGLLNDFPAFTALEKCRFLTCLSVESKPVISGQVMYLELPSMVCATFKVEGGINEIIKAIMWLSTHWLPDSGYKIKHDPIKLKALSAPANSHLHDIKYQVYLAITPK